MNSGMIVKNYVGIDLSKKQMEIIRLSSDGSKLRFRVDTTQSGEKSLLRWLRNDDLIILEAGSQAFRIAKRLMSEGYEVLVLNPGDVRTIYASLKKTDQEDALKLARLAQRNPVEELPTVRIPDDKDEDARRLATEQEFWSNQKTMNKNRLHSLFTQAGLTKITKKNISTQKNRDIVIPLLPERYQKEACRLQLNLQLIDENLKAVDEQIKQSLQDNGAYTKLAMSMPGIGPIATHVFMAYLGDCSQFSSGKQVSYYAGLVPRVDQSGETARYGSIIKRGCVPIRRVMIQCAWALVKSKHGGTIKEFYERQHERIGKKKAIVATARKMLETFHAMMKNGELYWGVPNDIIEKKMKTYGLII